MDSNNKDQHEEADIEIHVEGQIFKASKSKLCECSPVFNAMFSHEMKEFKDNKIEITNFDAGTIEAFLLYVDSNENEYLEEVPLHLYDLAEYYGVEQLKHRFLFSNNPENALERYVIATKDGLADAEHHNLELIVKSLNCSNCFELYAQARLEKCVDLESSIFAFVNANFCKVEGVDPVTDRKSTAEYLDPLDRFLEDTQAPFMLGRDLILETKINLDRKGVWCKLTNKSDKRIAYVFQFYMDNMFLHSTLNGFLRPSKSVPILVHSDPVSTKFRVLFEPTRTRKIHNCFKHKSLCRVKKCV